MSVDAPSVRLQVVLFGRPASLDRLVEATAAAARHAVKAGAARSVELALGDCSPEPVLPAEAAQGAAERGRAGGLSRCTYEHFSENLGSAGGSNRLAAGAQADFLFVLNPDTYPSPTALSELLAVMSDPTVGVADARQLPLEHPKAFEPVTGETSWASGACMMVRREAFEAVGGFDTDHFFLYCDDVDLSWRIRLGGWRALHVPRAAVFHDKRIDRSGYPVPTPREEYDGLLGRLMLAHRYRRSDIISSTEATVEFEGSPSQREALSEYRQRRAEGRVPVPVDNAERVAQFVNGEYAVHRF